MCWASQMEKLTFALPKSGIAAKLLFIEEPMLTID